MESTELVVTQEDQLAEQLAGPLIKAFAAQKKADKRFRSQNRDSWNRMNRPHKQSLIEAGGSKIMALIARFKV
jgi:hypothetical protein